MKTTRMRSVPCSIIYGGKIHKLIESLYNENGTSKTWNELTKKQEDMAEKLHIGECICKEKNITHHTFNNKYNIIQVFENRST